MTCDTRERVHPGRLTGIDILRELRELYETRLAALRHDTLQAFHEHTLRMTQLEAEYIRRHPERETDLGFETAGRD